MKNDDEENPFENLNQVEKVPTDLKEEVMNTIENDLTDDEGNIMEDVSEEEVFKVVPPADEKPKD
ncbi:MAG: hypothetical protein R8G66_11745 [Cytophagales bacterium]|nr:hypothetical protein [Cytophagales bacterium]